ncbi:hypothetical protein BD626DRAFT_473536 [Schizophyllum amplum]|uniref:BRCT domain-containing protein n=1 Tax=Schizophyllum amplum TaxID=97359 RepID=A0A550CWV6_9AGAR|nr:hypothetical protein BD626DRAFT_473536 [Auriculariopsis ampla]
MAPVDPGGTRRAPEIWSSTRPGARNALPPVPSASDLFVDPMMGCPLAMYVDKDVPDQAEIQRLIVDYGGTVSFGYSAVPYLLINPKTETGQRLWRQWAHRTNKKIVLDARWVRECIKAGELQTRATDWAGCRVQGNEWSEDEEEEAQPAIPPQGTTAIGATTVQPTSTASYIPDTSVAGPVAPTSTAPTLDHGTAEHHDQATQASVHYATEYPGYTIDELGYYHPIPTVYPYVPRALPAWHPSAQQATDVNTHHTADTSHLEHTAHIPEPHQPVPIAAPQPRSHYRQEPWYAEHTYPPAQDYDYGRYRDAQAPAQWNYYDPVYDQSQYEAAPYLSNEPEQQQPVAPLSPPQPEPEEMLVDEPEAEEAEAGVTQESSPPPPPLPKPAPVPFPLNRGRRSRRTGPLDAAALVARVDPPRSPTPPNTVQVSRFGGNTFTDEDKQYLDKYIQYCLDAGILLSLREICERVALKAPHHSFYSWRRFCNKHQKRLGGYKMLHCPSPSPEEEDEEEEDELMEDGTMMDTGTETAVAHAVHLAEQGVHELAYDYAAPHYAQVYGRYGHSVQGRAPEDVQQPAVESFHEESPEEDDGPPSRSPSPPRSLFRSTTGKGVAFTDADVSFLVRTLEYRRAQGRRIDGLFWKEISEKAPHHSRASWMKYWRRHRHELDPELADAGPEVEMEGTESSYASTPGLGPTSNHASSSHQTSTTPYASTSGHASASPSASTSGYAPSSTSYAEDYGQGYAAQMGSGHTFTTGQPSNGQADIGAANTSHYSSTSASQYAPTPQYAASQQHAMSRPQQHASPIPSKYPSGKPRRYTKSDDVLLAKYLVGRPKGTSDAVFRAFSAMHPHHPWKGWQEHYRVSRATVDHLVRALDAGKSIDAEGDEDGPDVRLPASSSAGTSRMVQAGPRTTHAGSQTAHTGSQAAHGGSHTGYGHTTHGGSQTMQSTRTSTNSRTQTSGRPGLETRAPETGVMVHDARMLDMGPNMQVSSVEGANMHSSRGSSAHMSQGVDVQMPGVQVPQAVRGAHPTQMPSIHAARMSISHTVQGLPLQTTRMPAEEVGGPGIPQAPRLLIQEVQLPRGMMAPGVR